MKWRGGSEELPALCGDAGCSAGVYTGGGTGAYFSLLRAAVLLKVAENLIQ